jgi:hypothetical protein
MAALWGHDDVACALLAGRCAHLSPESGQSMNVRQALECSLQAGRTDLLTCVAREAPAMLSPSSDGDPLEGAVNSGKVHVVRTLLAVAPDVSGGPVGC